MLQLQANTNFWKRCWNGEIRKLSQIERQGYDRLPVGEIKLLKLVLMQRWLKFMKRHGFQVNEEAWVPSVWRGMGSKCMKRHGFQVYEEAWVSSVWRGMGSKCMKRHGFQVYEEAWVPSVWRGMGSKCMKRHGFQESEEAWVPSVWRGMGSKCMKRHGFQVMSSHWLTVRSSSWSAVVLLLPESLTTVCNK